MPVKLLDRSSRGLTASGSRQMTIIYGGQVHVFDDVHPNKVCGLFVAYWILLCHSGYEIFGN